jgi:hypothetical protein
MHHPNYSSSMMQQLLLELQTSWQAAEHAS